MIYDQPRERQSLGQLQRTFTLAFKQAAVQLLETSGSVIAKEQGNAATLLYRWRTEMRASGPTAFLGAEREAKVRRLRRENDRLRQARDILKQAAASFCTTRGEVCLQYSAPGGGSGDGHVPCP